MYMALFQLTLGSPSFLCNEPTLMETEVECSATGSAAGGFHNVTSSSCLLLIARMGETLIDLHLKETLTAHRESSTVTTPDQGDGSTSTFAIHAL